MPQRVVSTKHKVAKEKLILNFVKNGKILEDILQLFKIPNVARHAVEEWEMYDENYAGAYFDENGYLNFCTVNIDILNVGSHAGQVIHKKVKYSQRYLYTVQMIVLNSGLMSFDGVCNIAISIIENLVLIEVKDNENVDKNIQKLIELLKNNSICSDAVKIQNTKNKNKLL